MPNHSEPPLFHACEFRTLVVGHPSSPWPEPSPPWYIPVDVLDGSDHSVFLQDWIQISKQKLIAPESGMLISSYSVEGKPDPTGRCPEGSTIFMSAHMLEIVDPTFAREQYALAKEQLGGEFLGFGYAKEWSSFCVGNPDIDSGPIVPVLQASASASGMAVLGAAVFDDQQYLKKLLRSLEFMGFPTEKEERLHYQASNPVGDAVLLYAMVEGKLWERVMDYQNDG